MNELELALSSDMRDELVAELKKLAVSYGLTVSQDVLYGCLDHLLMVVDVNRHMNLTRITTPHEALVLHILDSLLLLPLFSRAPEGAYLDMGTGAGYPGIPLALALGRSTVLLDSVGKKVQAVKEFCDALNLSHVSCVHDRLESYAVSARGEFAIVTARAVAALPVLVEYATPFLAADGLFIAAKARPSDEELVAGRVAAEKCGLEQIDCIEFDLPLELGHRTVICYRRMRKPLVKLPRAVGMAKKSPLA